MKRILLLGMLLISLFSLNVVADTCTSSYSMFKGETVIISESRAITRNELSKGDDFFLGESKLAYLGADKLTGENPKIKFKNFESGETLEYNLNILESMPVQAGFSIKLHGKSYLFRSVSDTTEDDFTITQIRDRTEKEVTLKEVSFNPSPDRYVARFSVNGEETSTLEEGASYILVDGSKITVTGVVYQGYAGGILSADFCIDGEANVIELIADPLPVVPVTLSTDLSNYPELFTDDGELNAYLVVGGKAPAIDNLAIADIAAGFGKADYKIIDPVKLDSELVNPLNTNLIVVGMVKDNSIAHLLMNGIDNYLKPGEGMIKLFEDDAGHVQLLVTGYSPNDTRRAAKVLQNFQNYDLKGWEIIVTGTKENPAVSTRRIILDPHPGPRDVEVVPELPEPTPPVIVDVTPQCTNGCQPNGNCLPYGTRLVNEGIPVFCNIDGNLHEQKSLNTACQNNYECSSNQCSSGQCTDLNKLSGKLDETNSLLEKILAWIERIFS